jgi:hypothetical protein
MFRARKIVPIVLSHRAIVGLSEDNLIRCYLSDSSLDSATWLCHDDIYNVVRNVGNFVLQSMQ